MQKKYFYMCFAVLFLTMSSSAMFKLDTMMRYVNSLKWLKTKNTRNFFQVNTCKNSLQNIHNFSKKNHFNQRFSLRWSFPLLGIGMFFESQSDEFIKKLKAEGEFADQEARKILHTYAGRYAITNYFLANIQSIIESDKKTKYMFELIELMPDADRIKILENFYTHVCDNFFHIIQTNNGRNAILDIVKACLSVRYEHGSFSKEDRLAKVIFQDFERCLNVLAGHEESLFFMRLLARSGVLIDGLLEYAEKNSDMFFKECSGMRFLLYILYPYHWHSISNGFELFQDDRILKVEDEYRIIELIQRNQDVFLQCPDKRFLSNYIVKNFQGAQEILELILNHLDQVSPVELIRDIVNRENFKINQRIADVLAQPKAVKCLDALENKVLNNNLDLNVLLSLGQLNSVLAKKIQGWVLDHYADLDASQLHELSKVVPCRQELLEKINIALSSKHVTFEDVLKKVAYLEPCIEERELNPLTTTENHLLHNLEEVFHSGIMQRYKEAPELVKMDLKLHNKIRELEESGYVTFVHGQRIENLLVENWFTRLRALKEQKPVVDFLYAHVKKVEGDEQAEQELRKKLLENGRDTLDDRSRLLFLNGSIFGNTTNCGSSSRHYTLKNGNVGPCYVELKDAFGFCLYERIYAKYENELKTLEKEFSTISDYGNTLLIAVPKNRLSECVFSAKSKGYKEEVYIEGIGETSDINLIMHTLKYEHHKIKNSDRIEFCLVMTQDEYGGLNPESGIKVYSYIAPKNEQQYAEFKRKENKLWQKIKNEIDDSQDKDYLGFYGQFFEWL